jgi:probable DNA repair protein
LLLSPYLAFADEEREARAEFDAFELRNGRMLRPEISLNDLTILVERSKRRNKLSLLLRTLREISVLSNQLRGMEARAHTEWAEKMRELLKVATRGAGSRENSVEFQMRRKWESALDELATLDFSGVPVEFVQAFEALERIAQQTLFAPESSDAPVQVMGPLEAAGGLFDAIWFLRAGELSWPVETRSNGLLPWSLQRELGMPGTDIVRDSEHARRMTERIAGSAATVVFSYAQHAADSRQRPSAMVHRLGLEEVDATLVTGTTVERKVVAVEEIEDVARVQQLPDRVIHGGARILELQAACGFRAFAEQRLWATGLESIVAGMDARESGTVVHEVLKLFWDAVRTQDALKSMTTKERNEMLDWCITEALKKTEKSSVTMWDAAYLDVQHDRLRRLLNGWLDLETQRALPFEVKMSEKEFQDVRVGPLRLNVRMDRVDEVAGGEVLIDYKTGDASPSDWLTERPDAPQLPLYAILSDTDRLHGVAFALVRAGEGKALKGYATAEGVLPGRLTKLREAPTFEDQVERWRQVLVRLAEQFHSGDARVDPKQYPQTCEYCEQRILCRLDVSSLEGDDENDATEEIDRG